MPSIKQIIGFGLGLVTAATALPAVPKLNQEARRFYELATRQTSDLPPGLTDVDILQFALTLEFLETAFYQQGFAQFPASDFEQLGFSTDSIAGLLEVGSTEQVHVTTLLSAIAASGARPVQACTYNFGFTDAAGMVSTALALENIGVSAYLAALPLLTTPSTLSVAASIATVEARHQTFLRSLANTSTAVPSPFDTPLGVRSVFSLAAGFISSCPDGSLLAITPFDALALAAPSSTASKLVSGDVLQLTTAVAGATFCAFVNAGPTGGTAFTPFANGGCPIPQDLSGIAYLSLASAAPLTGLLTDDITLSAPVVLTIS